MNNQSSVQWLFQQLWETPKDKFEWQSIFLMAHEMHKEEIVNAVYDGMGNNFDPNVGRAELYYNEKFNNNNE